jgi:AraC-like DNA-binding protein
LVSRTLDVPLIAVTQIVCNLANNGLSAPIPRQNALLVTLQLRDCPAHDLWIDGKSVKTAPLAAGTTSIYDLRRNPVVNSISPFHNLHFYFPRRVLDAVADGADRRLLDDLPHNPGTGMDDPVLRGLGLSLLPAFRQSDEGATLFVDHVTTAAAAHLSHLFGVCTTAGVSALAPWQERRAKELLRDHADPVSVAQLAQECGLPAAQFAAAFRMSTGLLPHRWLRKHRVKPGSRS